VGFDEGTLLTFTLLQKHGGANTLGRFRLSASTAERPIRADPLPAQVRRIISKPASERTEEEKQAVFSYYLTTDEKFGDANKEIDELMSSWPVGPTTLALMERKRQPRKTAVFKRGDFRKPGEIVNPDVPAILHPLPATGSANRLALAYWLVDKRNPLTARVIVNRTWQAYFGHGLVPTSE